jgi:GMP synthase-like glutamine amidotransferase
LFLRLFFQSSYYFLSMLHAEYEMRAHYLQHVPFEGLGSIEPWLKKAGYEITCSRLFKGDALPDTAAIDALIILGGPMSVHDASEFPWLRLEKEFIRAFIGTGKPVLGICLGAQLIAQVLGARISPNALHEHGWSPVNAVPSDRAGLFSFPASITVFHWHGETFDLPPGATRLATNAACANQAFQMGTSVIGLQFHLETTPGSAQEIISHCRDELTRASSVQTAEEILSVPPERYAKVNRLMDTLLDHLLLNKR